MLIPDPLLPSLRSVLGRLIPADEDPGALELGAEEFIHQRVVEDPAVAQVYERGLRALHENGFDSLSSEEQDDLLRLLEMSDPEFMAAISSHAVEAFYTHPTGLKMVGFEVTL